MPGSAGAPRSRPRRSDPPCGPSRARRDAPAAWIVRRVRSRPSSKFGDGKEVKLTRQAVFSGSYTGVGQADQRIVIHKDGSAEANMTIDFAGTACGQPVTLTFLVVAKVDFVTNTMSGTYVVKDRGASEARGSGTFTGVPGTGGAYEGAIHCA